MARKLTPLHEGRWAVVTGASSGIGRAHAFELAERGFSVFLVGRDTARLASTAAELQHRHGVETAVAQVDLVGDRAAEEVLGAVGDREVGVLVIVAGKGTPGEFVETPIDEYLDCVTLKVRNNLVLMHAVAQQMRDRRAGGMLVVSSVGGLQGVPSLSVNAGTEAYLLAMSEALHHELKPYGVRVAGLLPGATSTPGLSAMMGDTPAPRSAMTAEATAAVGLSALEAGRMTQVAGITNRVMTGILPRPLRIRFLARMMGGLFAATSGRQQPSGARAA